MAVNDGNRLWSRLRVYAPNGIVIGTINQPLSWEMAVPLNDMPSLTLTYHDSAPQAALLRTPCEVAVELASADVGTYTELPGCRFMNLKRGWNDRDRTGPSSYTLPSYGWQLKKTRFADASLLNDQGRRVFTNVTVGAVLKSIIDEAKARGNITGLTYSFTATLDSGGQAWSDTMTIEFEAGQDAWSILDAFARQGLCDWRMNGRALELYKPDTLLRRDLSIEGTGTIVLRPTHDHTDEPNEQTLEDLASALVMIGDKKTVKIVTDNTAYAPWGKWEETVRAGGVSDNTTLQLLGVKAMQMRTTIRTQMTKEISLRKGSPLPFIDYRPGDLVRARGITSGQLESLRVRQITLSSEDPYGISCNVVLNDRFTDRQLKFEQWVNTLSGQGGPGEGGGGGSEPTEADPAPPVSAKLPAAPTGVVATPTTYVDNTGRPVGQVYVTWNAVTTAQDGTPLTVKGYQIAARRTDLQPGLDVGVNIVAPQTNGYIGPLDGGYTYRITVTALNQGGYLGAASTPIDVAVPLSSTPPPTPSNPVVTSKLSTVRVTWDGLTSTGGLMPKDFTRLQVQMSTTGGLPWTNIGDIFQGGSAVTTGAQTLGSTRWFRFAAVNSSGLTSAVSGVVSIVVVGVQGPDIEANAITANNIAAGTITAEKIKAFSLSADRLSIGSNSNMIADPVFANSVLNSARATLANTNTDHGVSGDFTWSTNASGGAVCTVTTAVGATDKTARFVYSNWADLSIDIASSTPPVTDVGKLMPVADVPIGVTGYEGSLRFRFEYSLFAASWPAGGRVEVRSYLRFYDRTGAYLSTIGPQSLHAIQVHTSSTLAYLPVQSTNGIPIPADAVGAVLYHYLLVRNMPVGASFTFANPVLWQDNSVYIGDGMVRAPLIAADAITTDKLSANAITAKHTITGSVLQTAMPGTYPRVEIGPNINFINQAGIMLTPESGVQPSRVFVSNTAGSGGWEPNAFVISGPERVTNSTGRTDLLLGVDGDLKLQKVFVDNNNLLAGVDSVNESNELNLNGSVAQNYKEFWNYSMFRFVEFWWATGAYSVSWGLNNGGWYKVHGTATSSNSSAYVRMDITSESQTSFSWRTDIQARRIIFFAHRGSVQV